MLKKYRLLETLCNVTAGVCGILLMLAAMGEDANKAAVTIVLVLMVVMAVIAGLLRKRINRILREAHEKLPVNATKAAVAKRWVKHTFRSTGSKTGRVTTRETWCAAFETEKHGEIKLVIPREIYLSLRDGQQGILRYRGSEFISFN